MTQTTFGKRGKMNTIQKKPREGATIQVLSGEMPYLAVAARRRTLRLENIAGEKKHAFSFFTGNCASPVLIHRNTPIFTLVHCGRCDCERALDKTKPPSPSPLYADPFRFPFHYFLIPYSPRKSQSHGVPRTELIS